MAFDLEARKLVSWNLAALAAQTVRRRDVVPIELKAVKGAEGLAFPTDVTIYAVLKAAAGGPSGALLALANTFTKSGTGANSVYAFTLNLNTEGVNGLFNEEAAEVNCVLEVEVVSAQFRLTSEPVAVTVQNDYARESDGPPAALPDLKATQAEAEAGTNNEKWMTPLRTKQAIEALGGVIGWDDITDKPSTFPPTTHSHPPTAGTHAFSAAGQSFQIPAGRNQRWSFVQSFSNGASTALLPTTGEYGDRLYVDATAGANCTLVVGPKLVSFTHPQNAIARKVFEFFYTGTAWVEVESPFSAPTERYWTTPNGTVIRQKMLDDTSFSYAAMNGG